MKLTTDFMAVFLNCLRAMIKIFLICCVGVFLSLRPTRNPILPRQIIPALSRISNNLFLPCFILSTVGATLSADLLIEAGVLILFSALNMSLSYIVAFIVGKVLSYIKPVVDIHMFTSVAVAVGSTNAASFPILIMQTLCDQPIIQEEHGSHTACFKEATSMIFMYNIGWQLLFWTSGFPTLESVQRSINAGEVGVHDSNIGRSSSNNQESFVQRVSKVLTSPALLSIYTGVAIGMITPIKQALFQEESIFRAVGSSFETLGEPLVAVNTLIFAAALADICRPVSNYASAKSHVSSAIVLSEDISSCNTPLPHAPESKEAADDSILSIPHVGPTPSLLREAIARMRTASLLSHLSSSSGPVAAGAGATTGEGKQRRDARSGRMISVEYASVNNDMETCVSDVITSRPDLKHYNTEIDEGGSCSTEEEEERRAIESGEESGRNNEISIQSNALSPDAPQSAAPMLDWTLVVNMVCSRLLLVPLLTIPFVHTAVGLGIISRQAHLLQLTIFVQAASTSAQLVIIALLQLDMDDIASRMAYIYVIQHICSIFTITLWTSLTISSVYG